MSEANRAESHRTAHVGCGKQSEPHPDSEDAIVLGENFVNRYVVVLGRCGLGGTSYEIHATSEDLIALAEKLKTQVELYERGEHRFFSVMKECDIEWRESDPFEVLSEYVTLSETRTDRMCIAFVVEKSLEAHHVMKPMIPTNNPFGVGAALFLWNVVFPLLGVGVCIVAVVRWFWA